jgi:hypothetical protein
MHMIELSEEETVFSKNSLGSEDGTVSLVILLVQL